MESEGESEEIPFSFAKRFSLHSNFALGRPNGRRAEDGKIAKDANYCDAQPRGNHWIPAVFGFWYQRSLWYRKNTCPTLVLKQPKMKSRCAPISSGSRKANR